MILVTTVVTISYLPPLSKYESVDGINDLVIDTVDTVAYVVDGFLRVIVIRSHTPEKKPCPTE